MSVMYRAIRSVYRDLVNVEGAIRSAELRNDKLGASVALSRRAALIDELKHILDKKRKCA